MLSRGVQLAFAFCTPFWDCIYTSREGQESVCLLCKVFSGPNVSDRQQKIPRFFIYVWMLKFIKVALGVGQ